MAGNPCYILTITTDVRKNDILVAPETAPQSFKATGQHGAAKGAASDNKESQQNTANADNNAATDNST